MVKNRLLPSLLHPARQSHILDWRWLSLNFSKFIASGQAVSTIRVALAFFKLFEVYWIQPGSLVYSTGIGFL